MGIKVDSSGLSDFENMLEDIKSGMGDFNAEFLSEEFGVFVDKVVPHTPVDTGDMMNAYREGEIRQSGGNVEQEWSNEAKYASFVNDGTIHISPRYFWQKGMSEAEEQRESRYQDKFAEKFKG